MNGPRADSGERRQAWDSVPNALAHSEDSVSSSAPRRPSGATIRDWMVEGSTATYVAVVGVEDDQVEVEQHVERRPVPRPWPAIRGSSSA